MLDLYSCPREREWRVISIFFAYKYIYIWARPRDIAKKKLISSRPVRTVDFDRFFFSFFFCFFFCQFSSFFKIFLNGIQRDMGVGWWEGPKRIVITAEREAQYHADSIFRAAHSRPSPSVHFPDWMQFIYTLRYTHVLSHAANGYIRCNMI